MIKVNQSSHFVVYVKMIHAIMIKKSKFSEHRPLSYIIDIPNVNQHDIVIKLKIKYCQNYSKFVVIDSYKRLVVLYIILKFYVI